jgi:hypothetical protein
MDNKVRCPICKREVRGKEMSSVQPGPDHAFLCPYWREDSEENSGPEPIHANADVHTTGK